jgi:hypothetical protein
MYVHLSQNCGSDNHFEAPGKVIYPKYSKHWPYTVAHTIRSLTQETWGILKPEVDVKAKGKKLPVR